MERWLPIPDHEDHEASTLGQIRSVEWGIVPQWSGGQSKNGYLKVWLGRGRTARVRKRVHALVARTFLGLPEGRQVRHLNGDKRDNRLENLAYGTQSDQEQDKILHGTNWKLQHTACPQGHLFAEPNLLPEQLRRGWRACKACKRARDYARKHPKINLREEADRRYRKIMGL